MSKTRKMNTILFIRNIQADLKRHWKAHCARKNMTMTERMQFLMTKDMEDKIRG